MKHQLTDQELFAKIRSGDELALKEVYQRYRTDFIRLLIRRGHLKNDAEDIFQETVLRFYLSIAQQKTKELQAGGTIGGLLRGFLIRVSSEEFRKNKKAILDEYVLEMLIEDGEEKIQLEEDLQLIERSLTSLGGKCKQLLEAFYFYKKSYKEICKLLDYATVESAKSNKYKCLKRLEKKVITTPKTTHL